MWLPLSLFGSLADVELTSDDDHDDDFETVGAEQLFFGNAQNLNENDLVSSGRDLHVVVCR